MSRSRFGSASVFRNRVRFSRVGGSGFAVGVGRIGRNGSKPSGHRVLAVRPNFQEEGIREVRAGKVRAHQIRAAKFRPRQVRPMKNRAGQVRPGEICPGEVQAGEIRPLSFRPLQIGGDLHRSRARRVERFGPAREPVVLGPNQDAAGEVCV